MDKSEKDRRTHEAMRLFIHTNRLHMRALDRNVGDIGLHRGQHMMLMTLSRYDESAPSQCELASKLNISPAAVTVVLQKLEKSGYIERNATGGDSRCNEICITEKGREVVALSQTYFTKIEHTMFEGFSEEEIRSMSLFLERMHGNLTDFLNKDSKGEKTE